MGHLISELYAFVCTEADGGEGVAAAYIGDAWMPLVAADQARVESLRPIAANISKISGVPIRLVKFSQRENLEQVGIQAAENI